MTVTNPATMPMMSGNLRHWIAFLFVASAGCLTPSLSHAETKPIIEHFTLSNGMEVVVIPNHTVPAVNHMVWYRVGAADEPEGKSGLAHFLEHLMFRGTKKIPAGEFSPRIERLGGDDNAFTGADFTAYFQKIAKEHLALVMDMEADRMQNLQLKQAEIERERQVILEERQTRVESDVQGTLAEQMQLQLLQRHPYRNPIIGWEHELNAITAEDIRLFYKQHYNPANAYLVVSGDITARELKPLAEKTYGRIPAGQQAARHWLKEPAQMSSRKLTLRHPQARQPLWARSYLAPSYNDPEPRQADALLLLWYLLGAEKTGLLYQELVEKQKLATGVDASYNPNQRGPATFGLGVQPATGADLHAIEISVDSILNNIAASGVDAERLEHARRAMTAWRIYSQEGLQSMAFSIGMLMAAGLNADHYLGYSDRINAVTADDVKHAAAAVLRAEHSVTATVEPASEDAPAKPKAAQKR